MPIEQARAVRLRTGSRHTRSADGLPAQSRGQRQSSAHVQSARENVHLKFAEAPRASLHVQRAPHEPRAALRHAALHAPRASVLHGLRDVLLCAPLLDLGARPEQQQIRPLLTKMTQKWRQRLRIASWVPRREIDFDTRRGRRRVTQFKLAGYVSKESYRRTREPLYLSRGHLADSRLLHRPTGWRSRSSSALFASQSLRLAG